MNNNENNFVYFISYCSYTFTNTKNYNYSLWYTIPSETDYNSLSYVVQERILEEWSLHYPLYAMVNENKYRVSSKIQSVYFGYDDMRLLFRYPADYVSIYYKWSTPNDPCSYFASGKMDSYDIRWRCSLNFLSIFSS